MKNIFLLALLASTLGCVKEKKQQIEQNIVVQAMTTGQWKVTSFTRAGTDVTSDFSPYKFKFNENLTIDAINSGVVETSGTWNADANAQTITSSFTTASNPLPLLNGTWAITNNSWTWVLASQTVGGELRNLRLDKE